MTELIMRYWRALSSRAVPRKDAMSPTERFEHLALFMQAGYLGMSWYIDVSEPPADPSRE
jgi:hypothetical protein